MAGAGRKQRGRGRGYPDGGSDRGQSRDSRGRGRGRGRGGPGGYVAIYDDDEDLAHGTMNFLPRHRRDTPRGRGSRLKTLDDSDINSRYHTPVQESTSRGNGFRYDKLATERAPRRHLESKVLRGKISLSQQLYENRPLLKPIAFVPSKLPSLFLNEEEIFKPMAEEADEQEASHAPTADRVSQIFHRSNLNPNSSESPSGAELPEIDFMDLGRIMNEIEGFGVEAASSKNDSGTSIKMAEGQTTATTVGTSFMRDRIDIKPSPVQDSLTPANHIQLNDDDEIIVYVAPNPRKGMHISSSIPSTFAAVVTIPPVADSETVSGQVQQGGNDHPTHSERIPTPPSPKLSPVFTSGDVSNVALSGSSRSVRPVRRPPRVSKRRVKRHVTFGSFGAIRAEAALREVDLQRDEQRRGDSDVDWGGSTSEGSSEDGGMQVDQDGDVYAMETFVKGMSILGSAQVTSDDLEDEARIRAEDEDEEKSNDESAHESNSSTDQYDEESDVASETRIMSISDEGDIAIEDEGTSEEEETSKGSFQARLERLRKQTQGRPIRDVLKDELDGEPEAEEEDSIIAQIQEILDDNDEILRAQDRRQRNRIFQAINHGQPEFEIDFADSPARRKKNKYIPEELREQWERDRAKKAERKRVRELERSAAALDVFETRKGRKKKKARKARQAAALASPMSLETVVGLMRQFVADIGGARTHPLPPMDPQMRKTVHELAHAFKLNSKSKSSGSGRFTTLTKTTLSGMNVDEKAIGRILRYSSSNITHEGGKGKGRRGAGRIRPRDGEVVGETAPKIDGSNIGFQMLSAMGWEEGGRIGSVGGLEAPLVAVIKTTKLGLGATRSSS
ncbi:hypothetical protein BGY98DRAFT_1018014 [Russula aff. rugulosa BPL654]|nr:hypothetical protein BGY98DRAFT_1018014 [Russula aff. rugulosa BPL654]